MVPDTAMGPHENVKMLPKFDKYDFFFHSFKTLFHSNLYYNPSTIMEVKLRGNSFDVHPHKITIIVIGLMHNLTHIFLKIINI